MSAGARSQHRAALSATKRHTPRPWRDALQVGWRGQMRTGLGTNGNTWADASVREGLARAPRDLTFSGRCCMERQTGERRWAAGKMLTVMQGTVLRSTRQIKHCSPSWRRRRTSIRAPSTCKAGQHQRTFQLDSHALIRKSVRTHSY